MARAREAEAGAKLIAWAAEELGVDAGAAPGEVRAVFLRKVAEEEFVPAADWRRAYAVLRGGTRAAGVERDRSPCPSAREWAEVRLSEEVEGFVVEFFELAPADRRQRWQELLARCGDSPPLAAWLRALEPGLGIEETAVLRLPCPARQLAAFLYPLFLVRPVRRPVLRHAFRQSILANPEWKPAEWKWAGKYLRRRHADLAALDREMLQPYSLPAHPTPAEAFSGPFLRQQAFTQIQAVVLTLKQNGMVDEKTKTELLQVAREIYPVLSPEVGKYPAKYRRAFMKMYLDRVQERKLVNTQAMRIMQGYLLNEQ